MAHKEWKHAPDGGEERMCQRILGMAGLPSRPPPDLVVVVVVLVRRHRADTLCPTSCIEVGHCSSGDGPVQMLIWLAERAHAHMACSNHRVWMTPPAATPTILPTGCLPPPPPPPPNSSLYPARSAAAASGVQRAHRRGKEASRTNINVC